MRRCELTLACFWSVRIRDQPGTRRLTQRIEAAHPHAISASHIASLLGGPVLRRLNGAASPLYSGARGGESGVLAGWSRHCVRATTVQPGVFMRCRCRRRAERLTGIRALDAARLRRTQGVLFGRSGGLDNRYSPLYTGLSGFRREPLRS